MNSPLPYIVIPLLLILTRTSFLNPSLPSEARDEHVAIDPESALAMGFKVPVDLVPEDLIDDLPNVPHSLSNPLLEEAKHFCKEGSPKKWRYSDIKGIGETREERLNEYLLPPACIRSEFQPLSSEYSLPGAEALLRHQASEEVLGLSQAIQ